MRLFVGNGIGPLILASVAVAASTILSHAACMCDVSKDFNRFNFRRARAAKRLCRLKRKEDHCQFLISKRDDDDDDDDTDDENMPSRH